MYKVSILYPNEEGGAFDFEYYQHSHLPLVERFLKPYGLAKTGMDRCVSGGKGIPAPFVCIGHLYFTREDGYEEGVKAVGPLLRADLENFTNLTPIRVVCEVVV